MALIEPLPTGGWAPAGTGTSGALVAGGYRVTATEQTQGRPGVRYAVAFTPEVGRGYTLTVDVAYSDGAGAGPMRLTGYWTHSGYGELPYGDGPYGGGVLVVREHRLPIPDEGTASRYTFRGVAPEGATGIAWEVAADDDQHPWAAGDWLQATGMTLDSDRVTLTAHPTMEPVPRVNILLRDVDELAERVTIYAVTVGGKRPVRGGWELPTASLLVLDDFLAPFGEPVTYAVHLLDAAGDEVGIIQQAAPGIDFHGTVIQHIMDPYLATQARLLVGSEASLDWQYDGSMVRPGNARQPLWVGSGRWPLQAIPLKLGTDTIEQARSMRALLGIDLPDDQDHLPFIALRTSHPVQWGPLLQAVVPSTKLVPVDTISGGDKLHWHLTADEVRPPGAALVRSALTWADLMATYETWDDVLARYSTWGEMMTDYSIAGAANGA